MAKIKRLFWKNLKRRSQGIAMPKKNTKKNVFFVFLPADDFSACNTILFVNNSCCVGGIASSALFGEPVMKGAPAI